MFIEYCCETMRDALGKGTVKFTVMERQVQLALPFINTPIKICPWCESVVVIFEETKGDKIYKPMQGDMEVKEDKKK